MIEGNRRALWKAGKLHAEDASVDVKMAPPDDRDDSRGRADALSPLKLGEVGRYFQRMVGFIRSEFK